jgi:glyoxylase-like metal-dependent hydrolase (beta-lactamase superfamily II)
MPSSRSSIRTPTSSTTTSPPRPPSARQSWRSSRRTCKRTTCPACPSSLRARPPPPTYGADTGVEFKHVALADGDVVELGNTLVTAMATPGHLPAHHAYTVADRRRGTDAPWLVFSGDSLLIGDVGRRGLHVSADARGQARLLHASLQRLLARCESRTLLRSRRKRRSGSRRRCRQGPTMLVEQMRRTPELAGQRHR